MKIKLNISEEFVAKDGRVFSSRCECISYEYCLDKIEQLKSEGKHVEACRVARENNLTIEIKITGKDETDGYGIFNFDKGKLKSFLKYNKDNTIEVQMIHDHTTPLVGYVYKENGELQSHKVFDSHKESMVQIHDFLKDLNKEEKHNE